VATLAQTLFDRKLLRRIDANGSSGAAPIAKCRDIVRSRSAAMPEALVNRSGHKTIAKNGDGFLNEVIAKRAGEGDFDHNALLRPWLQDSAAAAFKTRALGGEFARAVRKPLPR